MIFMTDCFNRILLCIVILSALFLGCQYTAMAAAPQILSQSGSSDYNSAYKFTLQAKDVDGNIDYVYLEYWWASDPVHIRKPFYYDSKQKNVEKEISVSADQTWRPPGSKLNYQWYVHDASGFSDTGQVETLIYDDNRYEWKTIESEHFITRYYADKDNAQLVSDIAEKNYARIAADIGYELSEKTRIYIYADHDAYMEVGDASLRDWAGGSAYTADNMFIMPASSDLEWLKQVIPHEFTHIVLDNKLGLGEYAAPLWLSEGTPMFEEDNPSGRDEYLKQVSAALKRGEIIPLEELVDFSFRSQEEVELMYAESYSIVHYLIDTYGREKFNLFIDELSKGKLETEALQSAFSVDVGSLSENWTSYLNAMPDVTAGDVLIHSEQIIWIGIALLAVLAAVLFLMRKKRKIFDDEEDVPELDETENIGEETEE